MKKILSTLLLIFICINAFASENYTIAIVPYVKSAQNLESSNYVETAALTQRIAEKEFSDIQTKVRDECAFLFKSYLIPYIELNKNQKVYYCTSLQKAAIKELESKLSSYYVKIANTNYSSDDLSSYEDKISEIQSQIKTANTNLDAFIKENEASDSFVNTLKFDIPTNIKTAKSALPDIEVVSVDDYVSAYLLSNYAYKYRDIFLRENDVDELIFVEIDRLSTFNNLKIYTENLSKLPGIESNGDYYSSLNMIFDKIIANNQLTALDSYIIQSLLKSFFPDVSIIKNELPDVNITIKEITGKTALKEIEQIEEQSLDEEGNNSVIYIDANKIKSSDTVDLINTSNYILLPSGDHYLLIKGTDIKPYVLKVVSSLDEINTITVGGNPKENGPIMLNSDVGKVNWIIDGKDFGFSNSLYLDNQILPSTILATKENFTDKIFELNESDDYINFSLNPSWMGEGMIIEKKQTDFYQGLLNYIIGCATFLSVETLNNLYGIDSAKTFINNINDGVLVLMQVDIIYQLVSYIRLATN
jgi:hypothetical protein